MSKYGKLLLKEEQHKQKRNEEFCRQTGHIMTVETRSWAPSLYSQEPWEVEFCIRCGFGIPIFA